MSQDARIALIVDEGLGNSSYLVDLGDGRALVVDPSRDLRAVRRHLAERALAATFVVETHLHADFVSGAAELARDGAEVVAGSLGGRAFPHRGLADGDELDLGGLTLRALSTPGHTAEHTAFLLRDGTRPVAVFTGGSLLVGSAARTDLVSPELTETLARDQYGSLRRLLELPDSTLVLPTHGAGSFCSAPAGAARTTTIGEQRTANPLLTDADEDTFVRRLLDQLGSYPGYFTRLAEVNRRGPRVVGPDPALASLTPADVVALRASDAEVIDVRPVPAFAAGHVPGSLSIPLRDAFATWLGWLVDPPRPLVFVRDADQDPEEIVWQALKVGFDDLRGELAGGVAAWTAAGQPVSSIPLLGPNRLGNRRVLDIRQDSEFRGGHLPDATNVELGSLAERLTAVSREPLVVMCGHGERAMSAASLLERAGRADVAVLDGGPDDWARADGRSLTTGP